MEIKTIFLDMDGVIVDFDGMVNEKFGVVSNPYEWEYLYEQDFGMSAEEFWLACDNAFWRSLEFTKEAVDIFQILGERDLLDRVCLLSKPVSHAYQGKVDWIKDHLPQLYYNKQFLLGPEKDWCAHPKALLIDDNESHCLKFMEAGGNSFLYPRPWNMCHVLEYRANLELEEYIDALGLRGPKAWKR